VKAVEDAGNALVKARLLLAEDARAFAERAKAEEAGSLFRRP
jgi:hypothetical protein